MRIFYVTYDGLMSSVFDSQVFALLRFLKPRMGSLALVTFERRLHSPELREKMERVSRQFGGELLMLKRPPFLSERSLKPLFHNLAEMLSQHTSKDTPIILHCRGQLGTYIGVKAKQKLSEHCVKVVADIRGLPADELLYTCRRQPRMKECLLLPLRYKAFRSIEKFANCNADFLCCVSLGLKDYIIRNFDVSPRKIDIVPCSVDTNIFTCDEDSRQQIRYTLHLQDKIVFTYCGSLEPWQLLDKVIEFFRIAKRVCLKAHLLLLIRGDNQKLNRLLTKFNLDMGDVTVLNLEHQDVPRFLRAADIGLIFREDNLLNAVSFPTKFGEYLASGLFVISTIGAREIARFIDSNINTGYILCNFPQLDYDEVHALLSLLEKSKMLTHGRRSYRYSVAREILAIDVQYAKYERLYRQLCGRVSNNSGGEPQGGLKSD